MDYKEFKNSIDLYLDGELDPAATLKFQELADADPACRDLLDREEKLRLLVREELSAEQAPDMLRAKILRGIRREDRRQRRTYFTGWRAAAAILVAILIGGGAYLRYDQRDFSNIVTSSVNSHRIYAVSGEPAEYKASNERDLLPSLQRRVQFAMALPSLAQDDIRMEGGRICLLLDRKSALIFYRRANNRLSLFATDQRDIRLPNWGGKSIDGRVVHFQEAGDYRVAVWKDGQCVYSLVAKLDEGQLTKYLAAGFKEVVAQRAY
jgi:anti-sigma factor RsiW